MSSVKIAIVTGSNKGIGFSIVKGLCKKFEGIVYLTARDITRANASLKKLEELNLKANFHQLDVNDQKSCDKFRAYIKNKYGGVDILVNNAAIYFHSDSEVPLSIQAEETIKTNYFGLLRVCDTFFDLLRPGARVVHISSSAGHLSRIPGENLRQKFADPNLNVANISELMNSFVKSVKDNTNEKDGWGNSVYVVSKVGVSALTIVQQKTFDSDNSRQDILVNCVHPGYVKTDMTNQDGDFTPDEGAEAAIFLSLLPKNENQYKGAYVWHNKKIFDWFGPNPKNM